MPSARRFPPPWSVDEADSKLDRRCFIVRDATGKRWPKSTLSTHFCYDLNFGHFAALRSLTSWAKSDRARQQITPLLDHVVGGC